MTRTEADEMIEMDVAGADASLVCVWRRTRRFFRATPYASRFELFMEWCQENGSDVASFQREAHEASVKALIASEADAYAVDAGEPGDRIALDFHEGWLETPVSEDASPRAHTSFIDVSSLAF